MRTALRKLWGDIAATPGRYAMMIVAIAVSSASIIAMLLAYSVLTRAVQRNYMETNPAAAQLMVGQADVMSNADAILSLLRKNPAIIDAEVGGNAYFKVEVSTNQFVTALIFIVPDLEMERINKVRLSFGAWPTLGGILLERKAMGVAQISLGDSLKLIGANGATHSLPVSGMVHDPALAPADTEHIIYAYMSRATFLELHESPSENFIKFTVSATQLNATAIENIAADAVKNITPVVAVHEVRVPPPAQHPHQTQMTSGLRMLLLFSVLAVVLGAVLIATTLWGLLAQQVHQIGIMKTIGASSAQIFSLYLILVTAIGVLALLIGFPLGIWAGNSLIVMAADLLNLNIVVASLPTGLWFFSVIFCIGLPVLMAIYPIRVAATKTVRAALDDYGVVEVFSNEKKYFFKLNFLSPVWVFTLRNIFRRRGRLSFTVLLLAIAGATFLSSQNLLASWDALALQAQTHRYYQIEASFSESNAQETISAMLHKMSGINSVEFFNNYRVSPAAKTGLAIERVYPDGGHGRFNLYAVPVQTKMFSLEFITGHWLSAQGVDEVVLNQTAYNSFFSNTKIGDMIDVRIQDKNKCFRLVGVMREPLMGASLYVKQTYSTPNSFRLSLDDSSAPNIDRFAVQLEHEFQNVEIKLGSLITENYRKKSGNGHLMIMVLILVMIGIAMILVGFLSLATVMSTNVGERLREFAVMRTLGAKNVTIFSLIINESLLIALCGFLVALPIAGFFSVLMVQMLAGLTMEPLSVAVSVNGLLSWLGIVVIGAVVAAIAPALNAMRFTIREVLAYS
jgi:putative ABC transport system permease protein